MRTHLARYSIVAGAGVLALGLLIGASITVRAQAQGAAAKAVEAGGMAADHYVPSRPQNLQWGMFPVDATPVIMVKSGETVRIDTLSHQGATQAEDPIAMLAKYGVKREEILQDVLDFRASWPGRRR